MSIFSLKPQPQPATSCRLDADRSPGSTRYWINDDGGRHLALVCGGGDEERKNANLLIEALDSHAVLAALVEHLEPKHPATVAERARAILERLKSSP